MRQTSFLPPTISVKALKEHKTLTLTSGRASSFLYPPKTFFLSSMPVQYHPLPPLKGKGFPYSLPSVRSRADPDVQAVNLQVTISHPPGNRLQLLSTRPAVTFPAAENHCPLAGTKLYCLVTEAHRCEQLAQGCYAAFALSKI